MDQEDLVLSGVQRSEKKLVCIPPNNRQGRASYLVEIYFFYGGIGNLHKIEGNMRKETYISNQSSKRSHFAKMLNRLQFGVYTP